MSVIKMKYICEVSYRVGVIANSEDEALDKVEDLVSLPDSNEGYQEGTFSVELYDEEEIEEEQPEQDQNYDEEEERSRNDSKRQTLENGGEEEVP